MSKKSAKAEEKSAKAEAEEKSARTEEIMEIVKEKQVLDVILTGLTESLTPLIELIVTRMTASLMSTFEAMMDQRITDRVAEIQLSSDVKWKKYDTELATIDAKLEEADVRSRMRSLVIYGMPDLPTPNPSVQFGDVISASFQPDTNALSRNQRALELVQSFLHMSRSYLDLDLTADDIINIRRLFVKNSSKPHPVMVEFSFKITRDRILQSRKRLRSAPNRPDRPIYINENLTKRNAHIFALARKLLQDKKIHSTWTYNGYTYINSDPDESTKPRRILLSNDLPQDIWSGQIHVGLGDYQAPVIGI